jgi:hypothetical protein
MRKLAVLAIVMVGIMVMVAQAQDTIPKGFKGDNIVAVVKALEVGTFHNHKFVFTGQKEDLEKIYTFKVSDDKVLSSPAGVWVEKTTKGLRSNSEGPLYLIKDMGTKKKNWIGQNVFGARTRVETETETKYFIIPNRDIGKLPAKPEGGKIGVLFIGKPTDFGDRIGGYVAYVGKSYPATIDMPYQTVRKFYGLRLNLQEVVVYDQNSGKVLLKFKP